MASSLLLSFILNTPLKNLKSMKMYSLDSSLLSKSRIFFSISIGSNRIVLGLAVLRFGVLKMSGFGSSSEYSIVASNSGSIINYNLNESMNNVSKLKFGPKFFS